MAYINGNEILFSSNISVIDGGTIDTDNFVTKQELAQHNENQYAHSELKQACKDYTDQRCNEINDALDSKQDKLEFTTETFGDINPDLIPTAGAVNDALQYLVNSLMPEEFATKDELNNKQDKLTFDPILKPEEEIPFGVYGADGEGNTIMYDIDSQPKENSNNFLPSGVIYSELRDKQQKLESETNALYGFDEHGTPRAYGITMAGDEDLKVIPTVGVLQEGLANKQDKLEITDVIDEESVNKIPNAGAVVGAIATILEHIDKIYVKNGYAENTYATKAEIGDISTALTDLHNYAKTLKGGEA